MIFSSNLFILYFLPVFLTLYFLTPNKLRNYTLLLGSLIFYAWGAPEFIFMLVGSTIANFYITKGIFEAKKRIYKRAFVTGSVVLNIGLLIYFKYANFFIENFNEIMGWAGKSPISWTYIILPIGISFFTFQSLTYSIDTYRGVHKPLNKLSDYIVYITMFPQMIAGPIVRYSDIANELIKRTSTHENQLMGLHRFAIGLAKKVLIADVIAFEIDRTFALDFATMDSSTAWIAIIGYTFQIYFDFSGYSDMAIGLGRILGFKFPENFDNPYTSTSTTDFWRRWHMTLGTFMKYYLYIPLGGNRVKTKFRMYFNLWVVFLASGLWHGASWSFVLWGAIHGMFIVLDKLFLGNMMSKLGRFIPVIFTFLITVIAWVFFRIENIGDAWIFLKRMFAFDFGAVDMSHNPHFYVIMVVATVFSFFTLFKVGVKIQNWVFYTELNGYQQLIYWFLSIIVIIICIATLNATNFSPFIYFRF